MVEELVDCSLDRKLLDAREHLVPRIAAAEHVQRLVVLYVRRNKSFQSVGGAAKLDEAREAVLLERSVAVAQELSDLGIVAEPVLGGQHPKVRESSVTERLRMATDQEFDDFGVVVVLERVQQRGLAACVFDAQNAWSRQGLDLRKSPLDAENGEQLLVLVFGVRSPAGGARVRVRSGEGEHGERRG